MFHRLKELLLMGIDLRLQGMKHSGRTSHMFSLMSCRSILRAVIVGCIGLTFVKDAAAVQQRASLDEINGLIRVQQREIDSLTAVRDRLRLDSARIVQESTQRGSQIAGKLSESDDAITVKKSMSVKLKAQYMKAQQDSVAIVAKFREQIAELHKELVRLDGTIVAISNDLQTLSQRRDQLGSPPPADDRSASKLQLQISRRDSTIRARQAALVDVTNRREKLHQDSLQLEIKKSGERAQFHSEISRVDSLIALDDAAILKAEQKLSGAKAEKEQKITQLKQTQALMAKQKRGIDGRLAQTNAEIAALAAERQHLLQTADVSQRRYEQLHTPYQKALTAAEAEVQSVGKEKSVLSGLRQKLRLDSVVSKIRDALDLAIQMEAERKKGAKKLVEQRENELDSVLSKEDMIMRATPGLRQVETRYQGSTLSQKAKLVDNALATIDARIASATALRDKASQNLTQFEKKNPAPQDPSAQRIEQIDEQTSAKKREVILMTAMSDSLNIQLQEAQTSLGPLTASALRDQSVKPETLPQRADKLALSSKRAKLQRDSVQNEAAGAGAVLRLRTDLASVNSQAVIVQNEIAQYIAERDQAKQALLASQDRNRQQQASVSAEKKKTDSLIASKQQEISLFSMKSEKLQRDSVSIFRQQELQLRNRTPSPASLMTTIAALDRDLAVLQAQNDSLKRISLGGQGHGSDEARKIAQQLAVVNRSLENASNSLTSLNGVRANALSRLDRDKENYDSLAAAAEQEIAAITTRIDKARRDSIAAENIVRQSASRIQAGLAGEDNAIAARQQEYSQLSTDYDHALDDSAKIAEKIQSALQSSHQAIRSMETMIGLKEKELADLQQKREKAKQDSVLEYKRQAEGLIAAHNDIVKHAAAVAQKKSEIAAAAMKKKKVQQDTLVYQKEGKEAIAAATLEIQRLNGLFDKKKSELARLQSESAAAAAAMKVSGARGGATAIETPPAAAPAQGSPAAASAEEIAQKRSEEIYTLLGENRVVEAAKRFKSQLPFLKSNLDPEAFQTLKTTIEQMGGSVK
jgi:hypothetical protein